MRSLNPMKSASWLCLFLAIITISTTGCANLKAQNQSSRLDTTLDSYAAALRWGYYQDAANFHVKPDGTAAKINLQDLENFGVTSFTILSKSLLSEPDNNTKTAHITAELSYYLKERGVINKTRLSQKWWYDPSSRNWLNMSDFPEFK